MAVLLWLKLAFLLWNVLDLNLVLVTAYLFTLNHLAVVGDAYLKIVHFNIPGNCPNVSEGWVKFEFNHNIFEYIRNTGWANQNNE